jgi:hypothetical protein
VTICGACALHAGSLGLQIHVEHEIRDCFHGSGGYASAVVGYVTRKLPSVFFIVCMFTPILYSMYVYTECINIISISQKLM